MIAIEATTTAVAAHLVLLLVFSQLPSTTLAFAPSSTRVLQHTPNTKASYTLVNAPFPAHHCHYSPSSPLESISSRHGKTSIGSRSNVIHASPLFGSRSQNVGFRENKSAASFRLAALVAYLIQLQRRASIIFRGWKRRMTIGFMFVMMTWSLASGAAFARTGGRSGGSFKRAPMRPSYSRPAPPRSSYSRPPSRSYNNHHYRPSPGRVMMRPPTRLYYRNYRPPTVVVAPGLTTGPQYQPYGPIVHRRGISLTEVALVTGTGLFIASKVSNQLQQDREDREQTNSALGPGFTMAKLTVSLNVPDRDDTHSILKTLQTISSTARTSTRAGVQQLISSVALELLRQDSAIRSAESKSNHYKKESDVERDFLQQSILERSKFDRELEYKDGSPASSNKQQGGDSKATEAVVTILMAIEGDSTQLPVIQKRTDVLAALRKLAVDSQVDDCLLSGEVTWSPELRSETLTLTDIYADYPSLFPV